MSRVVGSVQCSVYSGECAVCSVSCVVCSVQCAVCSVHCAVYSYQAIYDEVGRAVEEGQIAHTEVSQPLEVKGGQGGQELSGEVGEVREVREIRSGGQEGQERLGGQVRAVQSVRLEKVRKG